MKAKRFFREFALVFAAVLLVNPAVVYLWSLARHGEGRFDWGTTFVLAITFGILFPLLSVSSARTDDARAKP